MPSESPPAPDLVDAVDVMSSVSAFSADARPPDLLDHIDSALCERSEAGDAGEAADGDGGGRGGDVQDSGKEGPDVEAVADGLAVAADVSHVTDDNVAAADEDAADSADGANATDVNDVSKPHVANDVADAIGNVSSHQSDGNVEVVDTAHAVAVDAKASLPAVSSHSESQPANRRTDQSVSSEAINSLGDEVPPVEVAADSCDAVLPISEKVAVQEGVLPGNNSNVCNTGSEMESVPVLDKNDAGDIFPKDSPPSQENLHIQAAVSGCPDSVAVVPAVPTPCLNNGDREQPHCSVEQTTKPTSLEAISSDMQAATTSSTTNDQLTSEPPVLPETALPAAPVAPSSPATAVDPPTSEASDTSNATSEAASAPPSSSGAASESSVCAATSEPTSSVATSELSSFPVTPEPLTLATGLAVPSALVSSPAILSPQPPAILSSQSPLSSSPTQVSPAVASGSSSSTTFSTPPTSSENPPTSSANLPTSSENPPTSSANPPTSSPSAPASAPEPASASSAAPASTVDAETADVSAGAISVRRDSAESTRRRQPDLSAVPTRSNLKRKNVEPEAGSAAKRPRRCIQFDGVTVFYFPRAQGFTCIPSQGGSTLGMANSHSHVEKFTLADHVNEQRAAHRQLLARLRLKQRKLQPSASSSEESDVASEEGSDVSDSELDVDSYFFLRPVTTRQRRAMLRASGVRKIEPLERDECRDIRTSREFCGCACKVVCRPEYCQCAGAGIKCQVDRQNFPCGCTREGCHNPTGRVEFNPARVRSHFVETIMREQPPASAAAGVWASCGWQKVEGGAPPPQQPYMVEQELAAGYQPAAANFPDLTPQYQEDSYSENSDGSRDSYDAVSAGSQPPPVVYPQAGQTQSHYSSFSFEGGLQNYAASAGPPPPQPYAPPLGAYQQAFPACQAYSGGGHAYPAPHYTYPFNKYPPSGPGPGGGVGPAAGAATYPSVCGGTGTVPGASAAAAAAPYPGGCAAARTAAPSAAAAAAAYPSPCAVVGGVSVAGSAPPPASVGYPVVCYPPYAGNTGSAACQPDCSYAAPPPVYATAGPYDAASCTYRAPPAAAAAGAPAPPAGYLGAGFPSTPAVDASAPSGQERKYTDLRSVPASGQLESLTDLLQNKFTNWPAGGAAVSVPGAAAPYCATPLSEDSGVEVDECATKHAISPPADESIGEILKKSMVESVSA